jgi:hypothetical protein
VGSPLGRYCGDARAKRAPVTVGARSLRWLLLCGIVTSALAWCGTPALADTTPTPSPTTTTTPDAPPPDPYKPPVRTSTTPKATPRPARTAPAVHTSPTVQARHYAPVVQAAPRAAPAPTPQRHAKRAVHKKSRPVVHRAPKRVPHLALASVDQLLAAVEPGVDSDPVRKDDFLKLAGLAFTVLAAASLSFVLLSRRVESRAQPL